MKLLLVGPYPPPHGGVSVHIAQAQRLARSAGIRCHVLNTQRYAEPGTEYISFDHAPGFLYNLVFYARTGWTIHVHTNGHNIKSWLVALTAGIAGKLGPGSRLTLHSGGLPRYLRGARYRRWVARTTCRFFSSIMCVNQEQRRTLESLGVLPALLDVVPAFHGIEPRAAEWVLSPKLEQWLGRHRPLVTATASGLPEYGVELLIEAVERLSAAHKGIGCLIIGTDDSDRVVRAQIESRKLRESVMLLGDRPHGECLHLISRSDVFVRPTLMDGDSVSVREALALGVPVVASDAAPRPDGTVVFQTGNAGDLAGKLTCTFERCIENSAR